MVKGLVALAALLLAACGSSNARPCRVDGDCKQGGVLGRCLPSPRSVDAFCAYDDDACAGTGLRWGVLAGDDLAESCVDELPPDAGIIDGTAGVDAGPSGPPVENNQPADIVLGQPDFTSSAADNGGESLASLDKPGAVAATAARVWVADGGNTRVLQWNALPSSPGAAANLTIGQFGATSHTPGCTASLIGSASSVYSDGTRLYVADADNNRVLIWFSVPTSMGQAADVVLGQVGFTTCTEGGGQNHLKLPGAVWGDGNRVVVADSGNNRVLIWNGLPTSGQNASIVLGQADFDTTAAGAASASALEAPSAVFSDGQKLYVADTGNHRVLIWNSFPQVGENGRPADVVVGQPDFTSDQLRAGMGTNGRTFAFPYGMTVARGSLFVSDFQLHRVLVFTPVPTANFPEALRTLGQEGIQYDSPAPSPTPTALASPFGLAANQEYLFVTDMTFNRVLGFKLKP